VKEALGNYELRKGSRNMNKEGEEKRRKKNEKMAGKRGKA
jgi:hypothetical protein